MEENRMTNRGIVSIIVPCYNAEKYVDDAIGSLRAQTYEALDIIAVNDGSKDGTLRLLERHAAADSRVRILDQANRGLPGARNAALHTFRGDFVCFLDADDVFLPEKMQRQVEYLNAHPEIGVVYSDYYTGDAHLELTGLKISRMPAIDLMDAVATKNWFTPMAPLVRANIVRAVGDFDESLRAAEDWDYWIRCAQHAAFGYLSGAIGIYRTHPEQMHHDLNRMRVACLRVIEKHFRNHPRRYRRALATFYEAHAKSCWAARDTWRTGFYAALSMYHGKLVAAHS
jgi:glycosyltransferase involved in cell wall biosynthesis